MKIYSFLRIMLKKLYSCGIVALTALFSFVPFIQFTPVIKSLEPDTIPPTVKKTLFENKENKRAHLFSHHNVLVIVPHPDDDINLMGGILDSYIDAGSTVRVVFVTNGDYYGTEHGSVRFHEAMDALEMSGVSEENIIFLGYGDQWKNVHIYNAAPDEILVSNAGNTKTSGIPSHPAYSEKADYTRNNLKNDLRSVIEQYKPDTLFCVDMDGHKDHRAVSLFFDEVIGEILHDTNSYKPVIYKGFAYETSWYAPTDFYSENILSTVNPDPTPYLANNSCFEWSSRVRFPISSKSLSRFSFDTLIHRMLAMHISQNALRKESAILSGDRIFFERYTSSLLYRANFETSSNSNISQYLNDFKYLDSDNVCDRYCIISNNVWSPASYDMQKNIHITLPEDRPVSEIRLYDNPDLDSNILDCSVTLSNGICLHSGKLNENGSPSILHFDSDVPVHTIDIKILSAEGECPGFCEIEAYERNPKPTDTRIIKLTDNGDNFVYDYWMQKSDKAEFYVYSYPSALAPDDLAFEVEKSSSSLCSACLENETLSVHCPKGCSMHVRVYSKTDPELYDSIKISNPSAGRRALISEMQLEEYYQYAG